MARKPPKGKSLAELNPELAKEWHPFKNDSLTPFDVFAKSNKKVWWKCNKGDDHEWVKSPSTRLGCPICSNRKTVLSNCLATTHPELAKEWHPTNNKDLTPNDVNMGTHTKVWWKCDKGDDHEWKTRVVERAGKHKTKCPVCIGQKIVKSNCLATTHPKLGKEWHPTKNYPLKSNDVISGSSKKVWWKCDKEDDHEWQTTISSRAKQGSNCPFCSNQKATVSNCLATTHPELAKEWHPTKNKSKNPNIITSGHKKIVWWKCDKGDDHEWEASPQQRSRLKSNCPICVGQKIVSSNSLEILRPDIAKQWHPTKNLNLSPNEFGVGSGKIVWWKCNKGIDHEWRTSINKRTHDRNCPFCTLTPQSRQELTITFELLKIFKDINPKGFKTRVDRKLWTIDIYIPQLHLGIEFDGSYWHKDKQALDKLKTEQLNDEGFKVIRVREEPLKKLFETDVISNQPFNGKDVTDKVLKQIMSMFDLSANRIRKIDSYHAKKELQNEKGLEDYIEMILTEKTKK